MDEGSDSRLWPFISKLFSSKEESGIEATIKEAQEEGELKSDEVTMLLNVLRLGRTSVQEIIIPRPDIVCAEVNEDAQEITRRLISSGYSRLPIYQDTRDKIIGILHAKDLLKALMQEELDNVEIKTLLRDPFFIPETKNIKDLLQEFRSRKIHIAIAVDEYGGTSGLVTFEDVLEEIVGEIEDEYDAPRPEDIKVLDDNQILVSGRTPLDDLKDEISLELDSDQVETIGGYLCELAGRVPSQGDTFDLDLYQATVKEADAKQVRWILITPPQHQVVE